MGQQLPRPLAVFPSAVWSAWPLAALSRASARRAGAWPLRPVGAAAARLRPLASAVSRRSVLRRPLWCVLAAAPAVFFSPLTTPLFSPWRWRAAMRTISVRGGKKQLCPRPPKDGRLSCGHGPRLGCVRGHREKAVCLPASGRARSACRAVCAVRALRRASPPSSGGQVRALKGFSILQHERMGDGYAPPALRSPPRAAIKPETARKAVGGGFTRACTQNFVYKKPADANGGSSAGYKPSLQNREKRNPEMPSKAPTLTESGRILGDYQPRKRPSMAENGHFRYRRAVGRRGMGHSIRHWRRSAYSAANSRRTRRRVHQRTPCDTDKICHPAGIGRPRSSTQSGKSSESGAALLLGHVLPRCAARAASRPPPPLLMAS